MRMSEWGAMKWVGGERKEGERRTEEEGKENGERRRWRGRDF